MSSKSSSTIPNYKLTNAWEIKTVPNTKHLSDREHVLITESRGNDTPSFPPEMCLEETPMIWYEEAMVMTLWFFLFSVLLFGPPIVVYMLAFHRTIGVTLIVLIVVQSFLRVPFTPSWCHSYVATICLKYFSYRIIWDHLTPMDGCICVLPPHGLFPFGGVLSMFAMPRSIGCYGRGAAASFILHVPFFGQVLQAIGCVNASRNSLEAQLRSGSAIGVSSGGIAEMFETNSPAGTECIILKSRGGICKLALRTGADIIPSYLFGGTKSYTVLYDRHRILQWISRKIQAPILAFYGRFLLPIPYRTPLLCVFGDRIQVDRVDNPTPEQIQALLEKLEVGITQVFDKYKASYGWKDVKLVIK